MPTPRAHCAQGGDEFTALVPHGQAGTEGAMRAPVGAGARFVNIGELLPDGRIRLHEKWQWTSGDLSSGESVIEEIHAK